MTPTLYSNVTRSWTVPRPVQNIWTPPGPLLKSKRCWLTIKHHLNLNVSRDEVTCIEHIHKKYWRSCSATNLFSFFLPTSNNKGQIFMIWLFLLFMRGQMVRLISSVRISWAMAVLGRLCFFVFVRVRIVWCNIEFQLLVPKLWIVTSILKQGFMSSRLEYFTIWYEQDSICVHDCWQSKMLCWKRVRIQLWFECKK